MKACLTESEMNPRKRIAWTGLTIDFFIPMKYPQATRMDAVMTRLQFANSSGESAFLAGLRG